MGARHRAIAAALTILSASGAARLASRWTRGLGAILMFHRVKPPEADAFQPNRLLEITPAFLGETLSLLRERGYEIVPLSAVPERLARPDPAKPFAALTFDDATRDTAEHAWPVLRRHQAPFSIFVAQGLTEATHPLWWVDLEEAIRRLQTIDVALPGGVALSLPAGTAAEKTAAFAAVYQTLRAAPEETLRATIAALSVRAGHDPLANARALCLGWQDLKEMSTDPLVSFGAHTVSHLMLAKHDEVTARREMALSRLAIESNLGVRVRDLAYPVGDPTSAGPREFRLAADLGFRLAVTTRPGVLFPVHAAHPTALPRLSVNGLHQSRAALDVLLSGTAFALANRGRRLNVG
jgi:peptidoglycan/xylan/chitin deacetylase (PgdA/CDA1 family)